MLKKNSEVSTQSTNAKKRQLDKKSRNMLTIGLYYKTEEFATQAHQSSKKYDFMSDNGADTLLSK